MLTRKMKDSGIEWIGKIPEEWMITSLQRLFFIQAGGDAKKEYYNSKRDKKYCYPVYTNSKDEHSVYAYTSNPIFPANCITVSGRGAIGKAFYRKTPFDAIIRLLVLKPKTKSISEFYTYFIDTVLVFNTGSSAVGQLSTIQIAPYKVAVPPIEEQQSIVNVLNKKTERISLIIKQTQQSIEELKKYKQSLITEAVTKGLDPNVEMKDSGIEWIGKIPKHWKEKRLKYLFQLIDERNSDPDAELLSLYTALGVRPRAELEERGNKAQTRLNYKIVKKGDLVVNKLLAWMGAIAFSNYEGVTSPDYDVYRIINNKTTNLKFYNYYFRHTNFKDDCYRVGRGIMLMRWRTYPEQLLKLLVPLPSIEEQKSIVSYLDEQTSRIDKLIADKTKVIEELEGYKKSLIYEYVTGKKEV